MSAFTAHELAYLQGERRLGRVATVGKDGTPHVAPVGWSYNPERVVSWGIESEAIGDRHSRAVG